LLNRRGFDETTEVALRSVGKAHAVAMVCDIDSFKQINDRYGHAFGDHVLASIGGVLRVFAADNDALVARFGGDEFVILMTGIEKSEGAILAEALRRGCSVLALSYDDESVQVTVSIGVSSQPENANMPDLLHAADRALYESKARGRNCVSQAPELKAA
jgi:diguanylate cyclase (GGDEF)-like protein